MTTSAPAGKPAPGRLRRSLARLSAVQAVYQLLAGDDAGADIVEQFLNFRAADSGDAGMSPDAERPFFKALVQGVDADRAALVALVEEGQAESWPWKRLDRLIQAIILTGAWELKGRVDVPARVVITEYMHITSAFYQGRESGFVNASLDRLARRLRPDEFTATDAPVAPAEPAPDGV
ncbi:MAG: transcription antitermination factor NusB [Rhodospirillales bacterium]|nr:MAG: transcription antitermination factor NusB [Rhodospirillales bacterium]